MTGICGCLLGFSVLLQVNGKASTNFTGFLDGIGSCMNDWTVSSKHKDVHDGS